MISKFVSLTRTEAETISISADDWLGWLEKEPACEFTGTLDHGGWSAAEFDPALRAKENVRSVHMLVLDYDKGARWDVAVRLWSASDGLLYTTKSHSEGSARLRVVMPFARPVTVAEYDKLWAWAAARSQERECPVDGQCKDASRFWYDPTKPPGGWRAERFVGNTLDPDAILAHIERTQPKLTIARPPAFETNDEILKRARAYLAKKPPAIQGSHGSTALFNAVADMLVGFALSEADTESLITSEYNPRCDPPWDEKEIQHKIESCAKTCKRERGYLLTDRVRTSNTRTVRSDATGGVQNSADTAEPVSKDSDTPVHPWEQWSGGRLLTKKKKQGDRTLVYPSKDFHNVLVMVEHYPDYVDKWSMDERNGDVWFNGAEMPDGMVADIRSVIACCLEFTPTTADVEQAFHRVASKNKFHPVRQYLQGLVWDGVPRLDSMASQYLGANEPRHGRLVRKFMVGAVTRVMRPGCKLDTALMLVGAQGLMKSTFFAVLGGEWHRDTFVDVTDRDGLMQLHKAWLYELAELETAIGGKAVSRVKAFMSSSQDSFRAPYARTVVDHPRGFVVCGTTNTRDFLTDDTGSRRFWIVEVKQSIPRAQLLEARDQLWAEAMCAWEDGEEWWLTATEDDEREVDNAGYRAEETWTDIVRDWLVREYKSELTVALVLEEALGIDSGKQGFHDIRRAKAVLNELKWFRVQRGVRGGQKWVYVQKSHDELESI